MKREMMKEILDESPSLRADGERYFVEGDHELTVFAGVGGLVSIARVSALELRPQYAVFETQRGERYFFGYRYVRALKIVRPEGERRSGAGFR